MTDDLERDVRAAIEPELMRLFGDDLISGRAGLLASVVVRLIEEERAPLIAKLDLPCGSCHPCVNWLAETWARDGRKPVYPHEADALRERAEKAEADADLLRRMLYQSEAAIARVRALCDNPSSGGYRAAAGYNEALSRVRSVLGGADPLRAARREAGAPAVAECPYCGDLISAAVVEARKAALLEAADEYDRCRAYPKESTAVAIWLRARAGAQGSTDAATERLRDLFLAAALDDAPPPADGAEDLGEVAKFTAPLLDRLVKVGGVRDSLKHNAERMYAAGQPDAGGVYAFCARALDDALSGARADAQGSTDAATERLRDLFLAAALDDAPPPADGAS